VGAQGIEEAKRGYVCSSEQILQFKQELLRIASSPRLRICRTEKNQRKWSSAQKTDPGFNVCYALVLFACKDQSKAKKQICQAKIGIKLKVVSNSS
jgi:hypothetical protein